MGSSFNLDTKPLALVVDDDVFIRADMADMVSDLGFEVVEADNVANALRYLESNGSRVSFLLTDVQMPGSRSGTKLANHVSYIWPHIRILVTSGLARPVHGQLPASAQFIPKPLTQTALNSYVSRFPSHMLPQSLR